MLKDFARQVSRLVRKAPNLSVGKRTSGRRSRGRPPEANGKAVGAHTIVRATCGLLAQLAPRDITIARVSQATRIDRSLVRYYFRNRANLMLSVAQYLYTQLQAEFRTNMAKEADCPEDKVRRFAQALLRFQVRHPYFHRLLLDEVAGSTSPDAKQFMESITLEGLAAYRVLAAESARRPELQPFDGAFLYLAFIGLTGLFATGGEFLKIAYGEGYDAAKVQQRYEKFILHFVVDGLRRAPARNQQGRRRARSPAA